MTATDHTIPQVYVEIRRRWADPWEPYPYLDPVAYDLGLAPTLPTARFSYAYGLIDDGLGPESVYPPTTGSLNDYYVRISRPPVLPEETPSPVWTGIITGETDAAGDGDVTDADGLPVQTGDAIVLARGLEYLLARSAVTGSWIRIDAETVQLIAECLPFNTRSSHGLQVLGNRSAAKHAGPGGVQAYVFSDTDGAVWTAADIAEYYLAFSAPAALAVTLTGATANLTGWTEATPPARTVLAGLNSVIRRDRGHAWRCIVTPAAGEGSDAVAVCVYSNYPEAVEAGGITIAAATERYTLAADADAVTDVQIQRSSESEFHTVTARGAPIILLGTLSFVNGRLEAAWGDAAETAYEAADDTARTAEKFRSVFTTYAAVPAYLPGGPLIDDSGNIDAAQTAPTFLAGRSFLRQIPLLASADDPDAPAEFRPPLVACKIILGETETYAPVDRLAEIVDGAPNWPARVLDGVLALRVGARPNHYLALNHWPEEAADSRFAPVVDYTTIRATVAWASTECLHVTRTITAPLDVDQPRTLYIDVPDAECWHRLPNTVTDVVDGELVIEPDSLTLRNDRAKLAAVCALAAAWHQRPRRAASITYATLVHDFAPGAMLDCLTAPAGNTDVYAIISRVRWDCRAGTTTLETDFGELDYLSAAGLRGGAARMHAPALGGADHRDAAANLPARDASAPGQQGRPFMVTVEKDGYDEVASKLTLGRGGYDEGTEGYENCTWTYTVKDYFTGASLKLLSGEPAVEMTPKRPRMPGFAYFYAGEAGRPTEALACRDSTGELVLLYCVGEITDYEEC